MFWVDRMSLFIGIFILLILSRIGSWRVYNLSLLYCIPLILIRMGLIKWCGSLQRLDVLKLILIIEPWRLEEVMSSLGKVIWGWNFLLEWLSFTWLGERFSPWIIWGGIFIFSTNVACARAVGNWWLTCSFTALMHIIGGCLCLASLGFLGCLSKWWIC